MRCLLSGQLMGPGDTTGSVGAWTCIVVFRVVSGFVVVGGRPVFPPDSFNISAEGGVHDDHPRVWTPGTTKHGCVGNGSRNGVIIQDIASCFTGTRAILSCNCIITTTSAVKFSFLKDGGCIPKDVINIARNIAIDVNTAVQYGRRGYLAIPGTGIDRRVHGRS